MNTKEIQSGLFYTGVNDRTTQLFESLWPLPYGVSYNSYLIKDDKTALFDTVELGEGRTYLENLRRITEGRTIDYLIVNHMEPDHSGAIRLVKDEYPGLKIVGNKQTIAMIKGYYHINEDEIYLEVKDGDSLNLGGCSLQFYLTPMVHWPETMMVFCPEKKVLFSGDAFGTFGCLNGGVTDGEIDTDCHIREMYRYYSNIVGKYGRFVQKAIEKVGGLDFEYICSTHGPIWNKRIKEVLDIVNRLSLYESEEGVTIIYGSMYGNTAEMAEEIASRLCAKGVKNIRIHNAAVSSMSDMITDAFRYKGLIVGSATYSMHLLPPVESFMIAMETREIKNKTFGLFGSFTWASAAHKSLMAYAEKMKLPVVASLEMKHSADDNDRAAAEAFVNNFITAYNA